MESSSEAYNEENSSNYTQRTLSPSSPIEDSMHYSQSELVQDPSLQESFFFGNHRRTSSGRRHSFTEGAPATQYAGGGVYGLEDLLNRQQPTNATVSEAVDSIAGGAGRGMLSDEEGYAMDMAYAAAAARRFGNLSESWGSPHGEFAHNPFMHRSMMAAMDPATHHFLAMGGMPGYMPPSPAGASYVGSPSAGAGSRLDSSPVRRARMLHRTQSLTNLASAAAAGGSPFYGMPSPLAGFPYGHPAHHLPNSPISPLSSQYMFQEQQMLEAAAMAHHSHQMNPLSSYFFNAAAAAAHAQATTAAAAHMRAAAAGKDEKLSDADVKLLKAAKRLAEAQSSPLSNVQSEAEAASIRDRHRQALAEAALYTQSQQAAAAITAAAYASLSPISTGGAKRSPSQTRPESPLSPNKPGRQRRHISPSPTRYDSDGERGMAGGVGSVGVLGMIGRSSRRGSLRQRPSVGGLDMASLGGHSAPGSARMMDSPAGLWADSLYDDDAVTATPENSGGSGEDEVEENAGRVARVRRGGGGSTTGMESDDVPTAYQAALASSASQAPQKRRRSGASSATMGAITANGRYECQWANCGKTFSTSGHLSRHARIHLGFKPFECDYPGCDARFSRSDNMRMHRKTHDRGGEKASSGMGITIPAEVSGVDSDLTSPVDSHVDSRPASPAGEDSIGHLKIQEQNAPAQSYPSPLNTPAANSGGRMSRKSSAQRLQQKQQPQQQQQLYHKLQHP
ncbi:hypothetical protein HDU67_009260, partial [Dinochytrium kinnereticum]